MCAYVRDTWHVIAAPVIGATTAREGIMLLCVSPSLNPRHETIAETPRVKTVAENSRHKAIVDRSALVGLFR